MYRNEFEIEALGSPGIYNVRLERWYESEAPPGETTCVHVATYANVGWIMAQSPTLYTAEVSRALPDGTGRCFVRLGNYSSLEAAADAVREAYDEKQDLPVVIRRSAQRGIAVA